MAARKNKPVPPNASELKEAAAPREADLTPMKKQYYEMKRQYSDCMLFFRPGRLLRDVRRGRRHRLARAGPHADDARPGQARRGADAHVRRPLSRGAVVHRPAAAKGYKVAVCEQTEDPALAKGLVKRDVIRIITPGTVTEDSMLEQGKSNFVCAVYHRREGRGCGLLRRLHGRVLRRRLRRFRRAAPGDELGRFSPREAVLSEGAAQDAEIIDFLAPPAGLYAGAGRRALRAGGRGRSGSAPSSARTTSNPWA